MRKYQFDLHSVELSEEVIKSYDCILLATNHDCFDYPMIRENAALIVDTRGYYEQAENIIKA